jgi:hypothetical protein
MNRRQLLCFFSCVMIASSGSQASAQFIAGGGVTKFSAGLPPTKSVDQTQVPLFATYHGSATTVTLSNTKIFMEPTTSTPNPDEFDTFNAAMSGQISINGSPNQSHNGTGSGSLLVYGRSTAAGTFNSEILTLNLNENSSLGPFMLRESPTLATAGQFKVTNISGNVYHIDSFFDVFTELSLDGGNTWIPSDTSTHVNLFPEPASATLLGLGLAAIFGSARRRT